MHAAHDSPQLPSLILLDSISRQTDKRGCTSGAPRDPLSSTRDYVLGSGNISERNQNEDFADLVDK